MTRWQAFGIHLAISLAIFVALMGLVILVWYPQFFFVTDGGWPGVRIIVLVDLVLGPLLTLIVFRAGKPGLKLDLTLIGLFQAICLIAGTYVVYEERPIALVYSDGQFNSMTRAELLANDVNPAVLDQFPGREPKWLMVALPKDPSAQTIIRREALAAGRSTAFLSDFYRPFDAAHPLVADDEEPLAELEKQDDKYSNALGSFLAQQGYEAEALRFYPHAGRFNYMYLAFDRSTSEFVGLLETPAPQ
ncbi:MAG: hypothetical protein AAGG11_17765 [Pseudomonadota bacterium]